MGILVNLLEKDEMELEEALANTRVVEVALLSANPHKDWSDRPPLSRSEDTTSTQHPILGRLDIPQA
jgi:hypothetical protein